jgi:transcriptional regulator with XRE-family HTH domain
MGLLMTAGGGVTYPRVVELLKAEVGKKGQRAVSREIGIALLSVQRYIKGIGEPSQATLEKLAAYFGVSVAWLRGAANLRNAEATIEILKDMIELYHVSPDHLKETLCTMIESCMSNLLDPFLIMPKEQAEVINNLCEEIGDILEKTTADQSP